MSKKELRKELERSLTAALNGILNTRDKEAARKIGKTIASASKSVARKFFKATKTAKKNIGPKAKAGPSKSPSRPKTVRSKAHKAGRKK